MPHAPTLIPSPLHGVFSQPTFPRSAPAPRPSEPRKTGPGTSQESEIEGVAGTAPPNRDRTLDWCPELEPPLGAHTHPPTSSRTYARGRASPLPTWRPPLRSFQLPTVSGLAPGRSPLLSPQEEAPLGRGTFWKGVTLQSFFVGKRYLLGVGAGLGLFFPKSEMSGLGSLKERDRDREREGWMDG